MKVKIKPCPFCGGEAIPIYLDKNTIFTSNVWYGTKKGKVRCIRCGIETPAYSRLSYAVKKWNRRTEDNE